MNAAERDAFARGIFLGAILMAAGGCLALYLAEHVTIAWR